jgi:KUP system potassium uptake protein
MISVAFLVILFSVQKYATSKVGFAIGPALFIWFCCLGGIGIYNLSKYGITVFKAFNPVYIIVYFKRNSFHAWLALGGCLLCATGTLMFFFLAPLCFIVSYNFLYLHPPTQTHICSLFIAPKTRVFLELGTQNPTLNVLNLTILFLNFRI